MTFAEGSRLEIIGKRSFCKSGIEEMRLPKALRQVCDGAFADCAALAAVYVEDGCEAGLQCADLPDSTRIVLPSVTLPGGKLLEDLRQMKEIIIPEGTEKIGNYWFYGCEAESVRVPASVRSIGTQAFRNCEKL